MLRVGVVGAGHLGRAHLEKLRTIQGCELAGFYEVDPTKARLVADESGVTAAATLAELLKRCDVINVVTPTNEHAAVGLAALGAGCHVFIEKPIAANVAEAESLISLAQSKGLKLGVGHIERFNPAVAAMQGRIGTPVFIEAHRLNSFNPRGLDVAVILDLMIHDIDLCLFFTQSEVVDIQASAVGVLSEKMDIANVRLTFKSGCVANLTASRISAGGMRKIRIFQRNNYLSLDLKDQKVENYLLLDGSQTAAPLDGFSTSFEYGATEKRLVYQAPKCDRYDMLQFELEQFLASVKSDTAPPVTGEDGLAALRIALEIERIAAAGLTRISAES